MICVASMTGMSDMNSMEKSMLLEELFALCKADKSEREQLLLKPNRMTEQLLSLNESSQAQTNMRICCR